MNMAFAYSNTVSILTAQVPSQPSAPNTLWSPDNVIVSWIAPDNGGSPITGYTVTIKQSDNIFSTDLINCDQSASTETSCTIPVSALRNAPFSH